MQHLTDWRPVQHLTDWWPLQHLHLQEKKNRKEKLESDVAMCR